MPHLLRSAMAHGRPLLRHSNSVRFLRGKRTSGACADLFDPIARRTRDWDAASTRRALSWCSLPLLRGSECSPSARPSIGIAGPRTAARAAGRSSSASASAHVRSSGIGGRTGDKSHRRRPPNGVAGQEKGMNSSTRILAPFRSGTVRGGGCRGLTRLG